MAVHYVDYDRRLDEWVSAGRADLSTSAASAAGGSDAGHAHGVKRRLEAASPGGEGGEGGAFRHQHHRGAEAMDASLFHALEAEREEITKVKNIPKIQLGRWEIDAWYYSPFPEHVTGKPLYICEYTLRYMSSLKTWAKHRTTCSVRAPPGTQVYSEGALSLWEVDGVRQELYCQRLCLLSKLFLDHKTLYFDVKPFLFYVLTEFRADPSDPIGGGHELIGYFSKEKVSELDYNLACILTFPPYQRCGYGKMLISFSYELTKREQKVGSPEKPLSDLGKLSYRSYWTFVLLSLLVEYEGQWTIADLSSMTGIKVEDVISTLQALDMIKHWKGQYVLVVDKPDLAAQLALQRVPRLCDAAKMTWAPPEAPAPCIAGGLVSDGTVLSAVGRPTGALEQKEEDSEGACVAGN